MTRDCLACGQVIADLVVGHTVRDGEGTVRAYVQTLPLKSAQRVHVYECPRSILRAPRVTVEPKGLG